MYHAVEILIMIYTDDSFVFLVGKGGNRDCITPFYEKAVPV